MTYGNYTTNDPTAPVNLPYTAQPYRPMPQAPVTNNSIMTVFVSSESDVDLYPVAAGTTVMLISFDRHKFWLKSRGADGVPHPIRVFPFKEETPAVQNQNGSVSREEFDNLSKKLDKLLNELGGMKNE